MNSRSGSRPPRESSPNAVSELSEETDPNVLRHQLWDALETMKGKDNKIEQLYDTVKEMASQLNELAHFVEIKDDVEERLKLMRDRYMEEVERYKDEATKARMETLEERVKTRAKEEELRHAREDEIEARATHLLDERTQEIHDQNFNLTKDKILLARDIDNSRQHSDVLSGQNATLRRKAEVAEASEKELLLKSVKQKKEIAELRTQVRELDNNMTSVVESYEDRIAKETAAHQKEVATLTRQRDDARHDAQRLLQELTKLRAASTQLLQQRGELEEFFYTALQEVRQEVLHERRCNVTSASCGTNDILSGHTNTTALRMEKQNRLALSERSDGKPKQKWTTNKKGFPMLESAKRGSSRSAPPLPPIATTYDTEGALVRTTGTYPAYLQPNLEPSSSSPPPIDDDDEGPLPHSGTNRTNNMTTSRGGGDPTFQLSAAPTLKEMQSVDVASLSWSEKERVIRYLFKRLQQQQHQLQRSVRNPPQATQSAKEQRQEDAPPADPSDTFLTQQ